MSKKIKLTAIGAAIILLIAAALAIILFSGNDSGGTEKMLAEAGEYLESRDYDNAIAIYNRIISDEPECAEAYVGLSEAYYVKGRTDKALEVLEKGAENTDYDEIILRKSEKLFPEINLGSDDYEEAEELFSGEEITSVTTSEIATEITPETTMETTSETTTEPEAEITSEITTTTSAATTTTPPATTTTAAVTTTTPVTTTAAPVTTRPVTTTTAAATTAPVTTTTEKLKEYTVPDFTLMTADDAYAWCSKHNIILNAAGSENNSGEILSQSPAPGAIVKENSEIIVILN